MDLIKASKMSDKKRLRYFAQFTNEYQTCKLCNTQFKSKHYRNHITRRCTKSNWWAERYNIWCCKH